MFYSKKNQKLFTNREKELEAVREKTNFSIIGMRKIGKTFFLKEFMRRNNDVNIYVDMETVDLIPQLFAQELVGLSLKYFLSKIDEENTKFYELTNLIKMLERANLRKLSDSLEKYWIKIEQEKNDNQKIRLAFDFILELQKQTKKQIRIIFDEFQYITELSADSIKIIRGYLQHTDLLFFFSGSALSIMEELFFETDSPLFEHAEKLVLYPFDRLNTKKLCQKIMSLREEEYSLLHQFTFGHPFYVYRTMRRIKLDFPDLKKRVEYAFLLEVLNPQGLLYSYFNSLYQKLLGKKSSIFHTITRIISEHKGITILEISKITGKDYREISVYIQRLLITDIIIKKEGKIYFRDSVFRLWMEYFKKGIMPEKEQPRVFDEIFSQLQEKYFSVSTELGKAKEYEFKVKLEKDFGIELRRYKKNSLEFDLLGEKKGVDYLFEIKWKNQPTGQKEIDKFLKKVKKSEFRNKKKRLFFISKSGYTEKAKELAKKKKIKLIYHV